MTTANESARPGTRPTERELQALRAWDFTDDPMDPCGLCIVWEEQPDDPMADNARPVWPDGTTVSRIYRYTHAACQRAAIAYSMDSRP